MGNCIKLVIDTLGGDEGFSEMVEGGVNALLKFPQLKIVFSGNKDEISKACEKYDGLKERIEIIHAEEEITNYDNPSEVLFTKRGSSMLMGFEKLGADGETSGMITAGNTGVVLAGAVRYLSKETRVRPALAAVLPASDGSFTCLVDTGATIDCSPSMLHHFAKLGSSFMRHTYGIENPKIGLLSNGAESSKGNKLVKETYPLLSEDKELNFVGNVEGNNALSGVCDVLVCDGFAGNQVLKVTEGTATRIITDVMKYAHKTGNDEIKKLGGYLMSIYDIGSLGGGIILGCRKPVIKIRGNAGAQAVVSTAGMLINMAENKELFDKKGVL